MHCKTLTNLGTEEWKHFHPVCQTLPRFFDNFL